MSTTARSAAQPMLYRCAGPNCGQLKGTSDHWWLMWPSKQGQVTVLSLCAWDEELAQHEAALYVCGEECAHKLQSMFMDNILEHKALRERGL